MAIFVLLLWSISQQCSSAQSWRDDFSDGNADDGLPVTWTVFETAAGTYNVEDGNYVAIGDDSNVAQQFMSSHVRSNIFGDVSVQAQASINGNGAFAITRGREPNALAGYGGSLNTSGFLAKFRTDGDICNPATPLVILNSATIGITANEEVKLQLDIIGSELNLTAWAADQTKPAVPQLTATDDLYGHGWAGIAFQERESDPDASASFRFVQAVAIAEPGSLAAGLAGILCLMLRRIR